MSDEPQQNNESPKKTKARPIRRFLIIMAETIGALFVLGIVAFAFLLIYISRGPVNVDFLLPHIEQALNEMEGDLRVDINALELEWHGLSAPLGLELNGVTLLNRSGAFMSIREVDVDVALRESLRGTIWFDRANIQGVRMRVQRRKDGSIRLYNESDTVYGPPSQTTPLTITKIIQNLPPIAALNISDASAVFDDRQADRLLRLQGLNFGLKQESQMVDGKRVPKDVSGYAMIALDEAQKKNILALDFMMSKGQDGGSDKPQDAELLVSGRVEQADLYALLSRADLTLPEGLSIDIPFQARGAVRLSNNFKLLDANIRVESEYMTVEDEGLFEQPISLNDVVAEASFIPEARQFDIKEVSVRYGPSRLSAKASLQYVQSEDGAGQWAGQIETQLDAIAVPELASLWPKPFRGEPAFEWLGEKMTEGQFSDIAFQTDLFVTPKGAPDDIVPQDDEVAEQPEQQGGVGLSDFKNMDMSVENVKASFNYEGLDVDYRAPMTKASSVKGSGSVEGKTMLLNIEAAKIGGMNVTKGRLYFDDLITAGEGNVDIDLSIRAKADDVLRYLTAEPINFGKNMKLDLPRTKGAASMEVEVNFPAVKGLRVEDIKVKVEGTLENAVLPGVLSGLDLDGGPFKITASDSEYRMTGAGRLDGRDVTLDWHSYFSKGAGKPYESRIKADLVIDDALRDKLGVDIDDFIEGAVPAKIDVRQGWDKKDLLNIEGQLKPTIVKLDPFNFKKPAGRDGSFSAEAELQNGRILKLNNLNIKSDDITLQNGDFDFTRDSKGRVLISDGNIERLVFEDNDFSVRLREEASGLMKIDVKGARLDATPFLSGDDADGANSDAAGSSSQEARLAAYEIGLDVQRVKTTAKEFMNAVKAYILLEGKKVNQLEVDAVVGRGALYMRYKPNMEDRFSLRIEADDAGATLKAIGLTDKVTGGRLTVAGIPHREGYVGDVRGTARIDNFKVRAAPALANLIKLVDLPTLMTSLNSDGLSFRRMETEFEWFNRHGGGAIKFIDGRSSGGSLGITFKGVVHKTNNTIDLEGTVVPASTLNSFFSGIPVVGQLITGGSGSLFAATYKMTGEADDPKTSINPLSVLAPGFLRKLLFEN